MAKIRAGVRGNNHAFPRSLSYCRFSHQLRINTSETMWVSRGTNEGSGLPSLRIRSRHNHCAVYPSRNLGGCRFRGSLAAVATSQSHIRRFLVQFCREVRAMWKPDKVLGLLVVFAGMAYQAYREGLSGNLKGVALGGVFPALWAACVFGCWLAFKAARVVFDEDCKAHRDYVPLVIVPDAQQRASPSRWTARIAPIIVSSLLTVLVVGSFSYLPPPRHHHSYFPWLALRQATVDSRGRTTDVLINFEIRDERPLRMGDILPNAPLENVRLRVTTPIPRADNGGWHECALVDSAILPVWRNGDPFPAAAFGFLKLTGESTVLLVDSSASSGTWQSIAIIRLINGKVETRQVLHGEFVGSDNLLTIDDASKGFPVEERNMPLKWDRPLFDYYKVHSVTSDRVGAACRDMQLLYRP